MDGSICTEITWQLCFPFQLLLPAPFGSSVGKPDLRENRDCHWLCFQPPGTSCSYHVSLAWTQKVEPSPILTPLHPAPAFALCLFPHLKGLGEGKEERAMDRKARRISSLFFIQTSFFTLLLLSLPPQTQSPDQDILLYSFLTLCSRAHSLSLCLQAERWQQPAFHGPLNLDTAHAGTL